MLTGPSPSSATAYRSDYNLHKLNYYADGANKNPTIRPYVFFVFIFTISIEAMLTHFLGVSFYLLILVCFELPTGKKKQVDEGSHCQ